LCRCGTDVRIQKAIKPAAELQNGGLKMIHHRLELSDPVLSRRSFVVSSAGTGGGLMLSLSLAFGEMVGANPESFATNAFIRIGADGLIILAMPYVELGEGTYSPIANVIADELEVDSNQVKLEDASLNEKRHVSSTLDVPAAADSDAMRHAWKPLREAGATARVMLIGAAAARWQVDARSCHAHRGEVIHTSTWRKLKYGELATDAARMPTPSSIVLKRPEEFNMMGTPAKRLDGLGCVSGSLVYGTDALTPAVKFATMAQSPRSLQPVFAVKGKRLRKIAIAGNALKQT
jgi:isoquinoline 1-oxidoreductase beta subunit